MSSDQPTTTAPTSTSGMELATILKTVLNLQCQVASLEKEIIAVKDDNKVLHTRINDIMADASETAITVSSQEGNSTLPSAHSQSVDMSINTATPTSTPTVVNIVPDDWLNPGTHQDALEPTSWLTQVPVPKARVGYKPR